MVYGPSPLLRGSVGRAVPVSVVVTPNFYFYDMGKKSSIKIPADIKSQVEELVADFNAGNHTDYVIRIKNSFVYFDRLSMNGPVFRLKFAGAMNNWEFAIYKYSSGSYDPDEWFFPGSSSVNGTIEGAMKAGTEAYPINKNNGLLKSLFRLLFGSKVN